MRKLTINNHIYEIYDSIDDMPIVNFQKFNKLLLIDSGLGSDVDSIDSHLVNLAKLIKTDIAKANQEIQNLRQTLYLIAANISPKYLAFTALIRSIDGKINTDLSDDNLKNILESMNEIKHSILMDILLSVKKKLYTELEEYFPNEFNSAKEKESYDKLKKKTILVLESIINNTDNSKEIKKIENEIFNSYKPKNYNGKDSIEIKYDKQFETSCMLISQKVNIDAKKMNVLEFYSALNNIAKQSEAEAKAYKKVRRK